MGSDGGSVRITEAAKYPKIAIGDRFVVEKLKGGGISCLNGGKAIDEIGSCRQSFDSLCWDSCYSGLLYLRY
jgi:hypothetical protein